MSRLKDLRRRIALALHTSMDYLAGLTDDDRPYARAEK